MLTTIKKLTPRLVTNLQRNLEETLSAMRFGKNENLQLCKDPGAHAHTFAWIAASGRRPLLLWNPFSVAGGV
jgi:hypothetical protein